VDEESGQVRIRGLFEFMADIVKSDHFIGMILAAEMPISKLEESVLQVYSHSIVLGGLEEIS